MAEVDEAMRDDAYRAVGRYVVEFSRLVFHMRYTIERQLAGDQDIVIPQLALGELSANQIADSFFGICAYLADLDDAETKVASRLKADVRATINRRNDFAHGDWWIGTPAQPGSVSDTTDPLLWRTKPGRREIEQLKTLPVTEIDSASDDLYALRQHVAEFGDLCLEDWPFAPKFSEPVRVCHVFRINKARKVVRDGPATEVNGVIVYH
jgi:hypothetical protein